jgi:glucose-fructose oxidoreductase
MNSSKPTRRDFLRQVGKAAGAAMAVPYVLTSRALGDGETPPASERVTMGHVGVGGRGTALMHSFLPLPDVQSVAVSDCFRSRREAAAKTVDDHYTRQSDAGSYQGCAAYADFRDLIAREDIDAVVIATHDVWHVPLVTACARAGKDVYVEKPLGMSVEQNKAAREAVRRYGTIFQYGTQQRSMAHCRHGCELVLNGRLGEVQSIEVVAPGGWAGGSTEPIPVPEDLDYDMWLGPAPVSPYTADRCEARGSYFVYDNSLGFLAGWGAHPLDILDWAYGSDEMMPVACEGTGVIPTEGLYDTVATWELDLLYANGVPLKFRGGGEDSTKFVGMEGWIDIRRSGLQAEPQSLLTEVIGPGEIRLPRSSNHSQDFVEGVKTRRPAISDVESAVRSDTISHLGDIAIRTGRRIKWDPLQETIIGDDTARRMLSRPMRSPWRL